MFQKLEAEIDRLAHKKERNYFSIADLAGSKLANPSPTFQLRLAEGSVLGVGGEVEGLSGFVSIPLNFCGYSAVVGSITDRIREIRLAGKPPCWACLRTASSSGATYMQ